MAQVLDEAPPASAPAPLASAYPTLALFLVSVLGLFAELLLIRWVSTEIRIFAYLQNTVLVVCFLGLGMGCWDCRRPFALRHILLPLAALVGLLAIPPARHTVRQIGEMMGGLSDFGMWGAIEYGGPFGAAMPFIGLALAGLIMVLLWDTFVPVGRLLGRLLSDHPRPLAAYSANVAGSLVGVWLFVALSVGSLPPVAWAAVFVAAALPFAGTGGMGKAGDLGLLALVLGLASFGGVEPGWLETVWSPYQKLSVQRMPDPGEPEPPPGFWGRFGEAKFANRSLGKYAVAVNNIGYQGMIDLRPENVAAHPDQFPPAQRGYSQYDLPAKLHPAPKKMLLVGAGSGNDAAGALRNGAQDVVAVEIDPAIITFGKAYHPERPYADPRVRIVNDDARSYFATSTETFDVIVFGLLDSHTTTAMTNARLDHYVYTRESLTHARRLLAPGGIMVLSFEAQKPFLVDRMATSLAEVCGHPATVFRVPQSGYGWGGVFFVAGNPEQTAEQLKKDPKLGEIIANWQAETPVAVTGTTRVATDDWPYIYLEKPTIPVLYVLLAVVLAVLFARGLRTLDAGHILKQWDREQSHFFLLGAAFLLLEVQNVSKASVVLGNTWLVNAVIISGVLGMVLLANVATPRLAAVPAGPLYALLVGSCVALYFVDLSTFAFLPYATKAVVVGALTSLPMLFSGVVFARSFVAAERKDAALGANLFGSLAGALLQTVTFVVGIKALLVIVAALYLAAALTRPRAAAARLAAA